MVSVVNKLKINSETGPGSSWRKTGRRQKLSDERPTFIPLSPSNATPILSSMHAIIRMT